MKKAKISFSNVGNIFKDAESTILDMLVLHLILPYEGKPHPCGCIAHLNAGSKDHVYIEEDDSIFTIICDGRELEFDVNKDGVDAGIYLAHMVLNNEGKCKHCVMDLYP